MEAMTGHPSVALTHDRTRPRLALALALLSLPGSTLTWYLIPLGGLLIGLPLAAAAIVLAVRTRRELAPGARSRMATAATAIAVLAIAQMAVYYLVEMLT